MHCLGNWGSAVITSNCDIVYSDKLSFEWDDAPTLMKFELMARKHPKDDWRYL